MTLRLAMVLTMLAAMPAWACVPDAPTEAVAGSDASRAPQIQPGVEDVVGRPTTIPGGMGGSVNIPQGGQQQNGPQGATTQDLTFSGASGTAQGTVTNNPNGSITITPDSTADFSAGRFDNGQEGRDIRPGTGNARTTGGVIELNPPVNSDPDDPNNPVATNDGTGRITFGGTGRVRQAGDVEVNGGSSFVPGSPAIRVDPGRDRLDSNVVYGED